MLWQDDAGRQKLAQAVAGLAWVLTGGALVGSAGLLLWALERSGGNHGPLFGTAFERLLMKHGEEVAAVLVVPLVALTCVRRTARSLLLIPAALALWVWFMFVIGWVVD